MTQLTPLHAPALRSDALAELKTIRDWLRFGVTTFTGQNISFGHGTETALDEAAFLILRTLSLPVDALEPWLDARLTPAEREAIYDILQKRIETRLPAPYLVNEAWIGPYKFYVDERVIIPRSFIGELMCEGLDAVVGDPTPVSSVLDLCTGSGCLAIIAADMFPNASIDAVDISADALAVAQKNVDDHDLADRITLAESNLFEALTGKRYDLIISNPPYVTDDAVAAFPPEWAHEPRLAHAGGADGLVLVRSMLETARDHLSDNGTLIVEVGQTEGRLERDYPHLPFLWLDTQTTGGEVFALPASSLPAV